MESTVQAALLATLEERFSNNMNRHPGLAWDAVRKKLEAQPDKLRTIYEMERTGGEPDVIAFDEKTGEFVFCDCSPQSPEGRRSLCYDRPALDARKRNKPDGNAMEMAQSIGVDMLTEDEYRQLQQLGEFDTKTSSWIKTGDGVRRLGGALFCDRRYGQVFVYHNGADSYYASRGFRGKVIV